MTDITKLELIDDDYEFDELCPYCGYETHGVFNPRRSTDKLVKCVHCGERITPCSLCDGSLCGGDCIDCIYKINFTLTQYRDMDME